MDRPSIGDLADRVRRGDEAATRQLRLELQAPLARIVRRELRSQRTTSHLAREIRQELDRLNGESPLSSEQRNRVVQTVVGELCAFCIEQVRRGHLNGGLLETVLS